MNKGMRVQYLNYTMQYVYGKEKPKVQYTYYDGWFGQQKRNSHDEFHERMGRGKNCRLTRPSAPHSVCSYVIQPPPRPPGRAFVQFLPFSFSPESGMGKILIVNSLLARRPRDRRGSDTKPHLLLILLYLLHFGGQQKINLAIYCGLT